jgi:hypothetical protein
VLLQYYTQQLFFFFLSFSLALWDKYMTKMWWVWQIFPQCILDSH